MSWSSKTISGISELAAAIYGNGGLLGSNLTLAGNLIVDGNIINVAGGGSNIPSYTPYIFTSSGPLGSISYTTSTLMIQTVAPLALYQVNTSGTYTGSASASIGISALQLPPSTLGVNSDNILAINIQNPIQSQTIVGSKALKLINPALQTPTPLTGTASFSIYIAGFYFTQTPTVWTPALASGAGALGTITYNTQVGYLVHIGQAIFYACNLDFTYSGSSSTNLQLSGLPTETTLVKCITTTVDQFDTNPWIGEPCVLDYLQSSTVANFRNSATHVLTPLTGGGTASVTLSGVYLTSLATAFAPTITAPTGIWSDSPTTVAYYSSASNITAFSITYSSTVTASTMGLQLTGLPNNQAGISVVKSIYTTGLTGPLTLVGVQGTSTMNFVDASGNPTVINLTSASVLITITGYYLNV